MLKIIQAPSPAKTGEVLSNLFIEAKGQKVFLNYSDDLIIPRQAQQSGVQLFINNVNTLEALVDVLSWPRLAAIGTTLSLEDIMLAAGPVIEEDQPTFNGFMEYLYSRG